MATINCDMGEAFGLYRMGDDNALMPLISVANVACGFHAGDLARGRERAGVHSDLRDMSRTVPGHL